MFLRLPDKIKVLHFLFLCFFCNNKNLPTHSTESTFTSTVTKVNLFKLSVDQIPHLNVSQTNSELERFEFTVNINVTYSYISSCQKYITGMYLPSHLTGQGRPGQIRHIMMSEF